VRAGARMVCEGLEGGAAPKGASGQVYVSMVDTNQLNKLREQAQQGRESSRVSSKDFGGFERR
jgi:hypothetical protein